MTVNTSVGRALDGINLLLLHFIHFFFTLHLLFLPPYTPTYPPHTTIPTFPLCTHLYPPHTTIPTFLICTHLYPPRAAIPTFLLCTHTHPPHTTIPTFLLCTHPHPPYEIIYIFPLPHSPIHLYYFSFHKLHLPPLSHPFFPQGKESPLLDVVADATNNLNSSNYSIRNSTELSSTPILETPI